MAEKKPHDVVEQHQSVGDPSPSDVPVTTSNEQTVEGDGIVDLIAEKDDSFQESQNNSTVHGGNNDHLLNGNTIPDPGHDQDTGEIIQLDSAVHDDERSREESTFEDSTARSDTDGSRAEGSISGDGKGQEPLKPVKKFTTSKPASFAKYTVPGKAAVANGVTKMVAEKASTPASSTSSLLQSGRPRLVAKTTSSLQQKAKLYKNTTPDPMQVWNKNRITPQPSTKHLTDEELKQQYGIHLTSRIQEDGDAEKAKWADIDDDEDDWAPATIEWTDGTKSTVDSTKVSETIEEKAQADPKSNDQPKPVRPTRILTSQFSSTLGPNATVLKLGASAERQQAQKSAVQQTKGPVEKPPLNTSKTAPAPPPSKSPWAALPPVEKISPVIISPQMAIPPPQRQPSGYSQSSSAVIAPSPAKEISADDFSRSWRESSTNQSRELFMPNSGKYEAVPESRRRMSKHDQNFRTPIGVLQRPGQSDPHAPAEPSAAFQTSRTSVDQVRRRASSTLSGGSGQLARRLSMAKSNESASLPVEPQQARGDSARPDSREGPPSQLQTPTYQVRGQYFEKPTEQGQSQEDLEAQRAQQRQLMKEKVELARRRKLEEEERLETEKRERIKLKLASLGPPPPVQDLKLDETGDEQPFEPVAVIPVHAHSPPKPPQPLASGEPQQYGMMKVHPMDTFKKPTALLPAKMLPSNEQATDVRPPPQGHTQGVADGSEVSPPPTSVNGGRTSSDSHRQTLQETNASAEPSPRPAKAITAGPEARAGWSDVRSDHRGPQSGNLWGLAGNNSKVIGLGNGTFDQTLAGYAPQDLSSRQSYPPQAWLNGRGPVEQRSPQSQFVVNALPDARSQVQSSISSAEQQSLAANSEADSLHPTTKPAPIGPPQAQNLSQSWQASPTIPQASIGVAGWNNFHQVASQQERAESERVQRELAAKREEELRTGTRAAPSYTFNETWKQVNLGEQAGQRQVAAINQTIIPAASIFGAIGTPPSAELTSRTTNAMPPRGSRFFPPMGDGAAKEARRAVTYSHPQTSRSPSPPPAEEYGSPHPAYDGVKDRPVVHFPREKAIVKLPPAKPPTPPAAAPAPAQELVNLSWAARVSQPAPSLPPPPQSLRSVSTPIAQTPSWQARFDGLLRKTSPTKPMAYPSQPALAVASASKEQFDVLPAPFSAAVSLPQEEEVGHLKDAGRATSKDVEDEEDLFEDREAGSLPLIKMPRDIPLLPRQIVPVPSVRQFRQLPEPASVAMFMVTNTGDPPKWQDAPTYIRISAPGSPVIKKDMINKPGSINGGDARSRNAAPNFSSKHPRNKVPRQRQLSGAVPSNQIKQTGAGSKSRQASSALGTPQSGSAQSTQPSSPMPTASKTSQASTPTTSAPNGHAKAPRNVSHGHGSGKWRGRSHHGQAQARPQPQAQAAH